MPNNQTKAADRIWSALAQMLRLWGASVEEIKAHGVRGLLVGDLPLSHADASAVVKAVEAHGRKHGLPIAGRMSHEGAPQLLIFTAPAT